MGSLSSLSLDDFEGNANISVAIKSDSTVQWASLRKFLFWTSVSYSSVRAEASVISLVVVSVWLKRCVDTHPQHTSVCEREGGREGGREGVREEDVNNIILL